MSQLMWFTYTRFFIPELSNACQHLLLILVRSSVSWAVKQTGFGIHPNPWVNKAHKPNLMVLLKNKLALLCHCVVSGETTCLQTAVQWCRLCWGHSSPGASPLQELRLSSSSPAHRYNTIPAINMTCFCYFTKLCSCLFIRWGFL